jgi:hypothetical protein
MGNRQQKFSKHHRASLWHNPNFRPFEANTVPVFGGWAELAPGESLQTSIFQANIRLFLMRLSSAQTPRVSLLDVFAFRNDRTASRCGQFIQTPEQSCAMMARPLR